MIAGDSPDERESLRGLNRIGVLIGLNLRIQDAGITVDSLRPDIEATLRRANIQVVPRTDLLQKAMREPILIVNFSDSIRFGDVFVYNLELLMHQRVKVERNQSRLVAPTWSAGRLGSIRVGQAEKLREAVGALVDDFVKAYRSVNP